MPDEKEMISVIIPYNLNRGFLRQALNSIQHQTYEDWEVIHSQSSNSLGYNINRGVEKARGEYVKFMAEDDILEVDCLENLLSGIKGYDAVCADATHFREDGYELKVRMKQPTLKGMLKDNMIHGGTTMYRKEIFDLYGGYDEALKCAEEYDFNLFLLKQGRTFNHVPKFVYRYRLHLQQKTAFFSGFKTKQARSEYIENIKMRYR